MGEEVLAGLGDNTPLGPQRYLCRELVAGSVKVRHWQSCGERNAVKGNWSRLC